jgi:hypothetical protein
MQLNKVLAFLAFTIVFGIFAQNVSAYYSPEIGRFITRDPIEYDAGDTNLYRYVENSTVDNIDPMGNVVMPPYYPPSDLPVIPFLVNIHFDFPTIQILPKIKAVSCTFLGVLIEDRLNSSEEKMMWRHYTGGSGAILDLSTYMDSIITSAGLKGSLPLCSNGQHWRFSKSETKSTRSPWSGGLGTATFKYNVECDDGCLSWKVSMSDFYDFDTKPWGTRTFKGEIKTRLVDFVTMRSKCGWKPYKVKGDASGKSGSCCGK